MKKILIVIGTFVVLIFIGFINYFSDLNYEQKFDQSEFCYISAWGNIGGIEGGRICECDGELLVSKCPEGVSCEGSEHRCYGEIIDYDYVYDSKEFETIDDLENYCNILENSSSENCFSLIERLQDSNLE